MAGSDFLFAAAVGVLLVLPFSHHTAEAVPNTGGFTTGGSCKVTGGVNTGKTGTFDQDGDCWGLIGVSLNARTPTVRIAGVPGNHRPRSDPAGSGSGRSWRATRC